MEDAIRIRHLLKLCDTVRGRINDSRARIKNDEGIIKYDLKKLNDFKHELYELGWSEADYAPNRRLPFLWKVCFAITLEAGGLNRDRSEQRIRQEFDDWITGKKFPEAALARYDKWCGTLDEATITLISGCGEESELIDALDKNDCPDALAVLFNDYFDEVG